MTPKQSKYLWAFEIRNSQSRPINWMKQYLDTNQASSIIAECEKWESDKTFDQTERTQSCLKSYNPYFKFNDLTPKTITDTVIETKEVVKEIVVEREIIKTITLTQDMSLDDVIPAILPLVKGATHLQDLFDAKQPILQDSKTSKDYYKPENFDTILAAVKNPKIHVLLKGPAGSGKSLMGRELSKHLKLDFFCMSCSGGMRYAHIFGGDRMFIDKVSGKTITEFELSNLMQAIQKPCLILMDELFTLDGDLLMGLNGLFEVNTGQIETKGGLVTIHPECLVMAATNTDGRNNDRNHVGAKRVDGSSLDRFATFHHDYSKSVERNILNKLPKLHRQDVSQWLIKLRKELKLANITFDPSTRRLQTCVEQINGSGLPCDVAFNSAFLGQLSPMELKKIGLDKLETTRKNEPVIDDTTKELF